MPQGCDGELDPVVLDRRAAGGACWDTTSIAGDINDFSHGEGHGGSQQEDEEDCSAEVSGPVPGLGAGLEGYESDGTEGAETDGDNSVCSRDFSATSTYAPDDCDGTELDARGRRGGGSHLHRADQPFALGAASAAAYSHFYG